MMTIQEMIEQVGLLIGLNISQSPIGSTDLQIRQLVALFNNEVWETGTRYRWQILTEEATFVTVAQEDQGVFSGDGGILSESDLYNYIISDTMWDRTARQPIPGPDSTEDWQTRLAVQYTSGPYPNYRIRANRLLMLPIPAAGNDVYFEYATKKFTYDANSDTYSNRFQTNDDVPVLDSDLIMQGVRWRWKMAKGFQYAEEKKLHHLACLDAATRETGNKRMNLAGGNTVLSGNRRSGDMTTTAI